MVAKSCAHARTEPCGVRGSVRVGRADRVGGLLPVRRGGVRPVSVARVSSC
ncbi:hypothetical protein [Streptomyces sp. NPDC057496]|uniref:hypothetical protein n=1 Tax=Streptomyces sp. NPDC057496 TaxID=3346149 RepID=UPI0036AD9A97